MSSATIWIIDDDDSIRWVLERALQKADYEVISFSNTRDARAAIQAAMPQTIICDVRMPGESGLDFLAFLRTRHPTLPVIVITAHADLDSAVSAYEGGAFEYLPKPFDIEDVLDATARACQVETSRLREQQSIGENATPTSDLIGAAPAMQNVFRAIGRLARSNMSVLITGESGTGKELIARALHRHSARAAEAFIALNVAAIPHDLIESELFGHEKGAFTGAHVQRRGRFEQAHGGTLFLDEIGDMPVELQSRLLRVLAEGQFYRVGGHTPVTVDVRILTATHRDLETHVTHHQFREDLFHRLNVVRINVPPLRERREDVPSLLTHFLSRAAKELHTAPKQASNALVQHLQSLYWEGNVRQLENLCRWFTVMAPGEQIDMRDLPDDLRIAPRVDVSGDWQNGLREWLQSQIDTGSENLLASALPAFEKTLIECALEKTRNNRQKAAKLLGWGRNTLSRKIKELQI